MKFLKLLNLPFCSRGVWITIILLCSPAAMQPLCMFFNLFHSTVYDIPMKWELDGDSVTWCESCLSTNSDLVLKGVPILIDAMCPVQCPIWTRWPDRWSPGCPMVLQSMLPALVLKSITLCSSAVTRERNLQTVIQGCGYKGYPWRWWWLRCRVKLSNHNLQHILPSYRAKLWYQQGQSLGG